jgi:tetratricopeptide (TPR) repeat protein
MPRLSKRSLGQLPRLPEAWLIATAQLRTWIAPPDEAPYRPYVVLVLSADEGTVRGWQITEAVPTPGEVWDTLSKAMRQPLSDSGKPGVPQRIVVPDSALAQAILPALADAQLEMDVSEQPLPDAVTEIIRDLEDHLRGDKPENPALVSVSGVTPELLGGFYSAAADYYRAAPWIHLNNYQVLALRYPADREYHFAMSMGQGGIEYGLAKYLRWEDVVRQFTEDDNPREMLPPGGLHSLFYGDITQVPFDDLEAIEKNPWDIAAPEAYPIPFVVLTPEQARRPSREELLWYEAALSAIPVLVHNHLKPNGRGDYEPLDLTLDVPTHAGTVAVAVKYPAGEIPLAEQPAQRMSWSSPDEEEPDAPMVFDRRIMEKTMQHIGQQAGAVSQWGDPNLERAQELMYQAFEETNPGNRIALAHEALSISPNCADAYVLLAEEEADTIQRALEYYRQGVAAGERALGKDFFEENAGDFWAILETRPYMRARQGLAEVLWRLKRHDEALEHYREMVRLNPNDNQGIRYLLLALLLEIGREDDAAELLQEYEDEWSAVWLYTRTLLGFRQHGASTRANKALAEALKENPHVPTYLTGKKRIPNTLPPLIGMGDEDEAIAYASDHLNHWRRTPGAIAWLRERSQAKRKSPPAPRRRKARRPKRES